ncbi:hypothetical protein KCU78_g1232, partial [Aureobasidium melanogenum]
MRRRSAVVIDLTGDDDYSINGAVQLVAHPHTGPATENLFVPVIDLTGEEEPVAIPMAYNHSHGEYPPKNDSSSTLLNLPPEVQLKIFGQSYLSVEELRSLRLVSPGTRALATEILGRRYFTDLDVTYTTRHDRLTESQRQLELFLSSDFGPFVKGVTYGLSESTSEDQLKERVLAKRRKTEEDARKKKGAHHGQGGKREADYSRLERISIIHSSGDVLQFSKVACRTTRLKILRLHGTVLRSWHTVVPFHLAPTSFFDLKPGHWFEPDQVFDFLSTTNLTEVDLFNTQISITILVDALRKQQKTLSTLVDGQWSDLLSHIHEDLDSLEILSIKTLFVCSDQSLDRPVVDRVPDLELEGKESIKTRCRSLVGGCSAQAS